MSVKIPDSQLAVTLFNLREHCKTESDLDRTLDRVCAIGYQAVQVSGVPLDAATIHRQLEAHGLYCCAHHTNLTALTAETDRLIDDLHTLECEFTALGMPPREYIAEPEKTRELVKIFNELGPRFAAAGLKLGYHNHCDEFVKFDHTRSTMLDYFYDSTCRSTVFAEIDTHWVARGGANPVDYINRVAGRMTVVHFKDLAIIGRDPYICEIGEGNLNWRAIIDACVNTRVRWYSIEQDNCDYAKRDIFDSIKISYDYLRSLGVK